MITIGIGEINVCKEPEALVTYALGSCVGVCLYDKARKIAGMAHIMLPHANGTNTGNKYADVAIVALVKDMERKGAMKAALTAKIAGGAQMFEVIGNSSVSKIGDRNVETVEEILKSLNIRIIARDTGLNYGRTIYFYPEDGRLQVKTCKGTSQVI